MNLTDGLVHDLALYALDWDRSGRQERVQVIDQATGDVLDTESLANFGDGVYLQWHVRGPVQIVVTNQGPVNAVISGLFLGGTPLTAVHPMTVSGPPTVDANGVKYYTVVSGYLGDQPTTIRILEPTNPAPGEPHRFLYLLPVQEGVTTLSSQWGDGLEQARLLNLQNLYNLTLVAPSFPITPWYGDNDIDPSARLESFLVKDVVPFVDQLDAAGPDPERWLVGFSKSGFGALALIFRHPDVFDEAAAWDSPAERTTVEADMGPTFGDEANFVQYEIPSLVANDNAPFLNRNRIWISGDTANFTASMAMLDQQMTSAGVLHTFVGGVVRAHNWSSGWLQIAIGDLANSDGSIRQDTTTQGTWIGAYGAQGADIEGSPAALPAYASVGFTGASTITWAASTTDARALETPGGSSRAATAWYNKVGFTIDVNLTDGLVHDLALYALDWNRLGRQEVVQLIDPATGAVLDTESLANFGGGVYLQWAVRGHLRIVVTNQGPANAVISGLFLDAVGAAAFIRQDTTTEGTWIGAYGRRAPTSRAARPPSRRMPASASPAPRPSPGPRAPPTPAPWRPPAARPAPPPPGPAPAASPST